MVQPALKHLLHVLRANGSIPARRVGVSPAIHDELQRFAEHLDHVCGLAARTRAGRRWWVCQFLADRFGQGLIAVHRLTPKDMLDFLGRHGGRYPYTKLDRPQLAIVGLPTACWAFLQRL